MNFSDVVPLLEVYRGSIVESMHIGALVIANNQGEVLANVGSPDMLTYMRSSAKPFQLLHFIEMGGAETFGLSDREVALMCASHSGTDEHVTVVSGIQKKIGINESDLLCGAHYPYHEPTALQMQIRGEKPTQNRHNCSGKHTGMLAQTVLRGLPKEDYINPAHPLQQTILQTISEMSDTPVDQIPVGIDGCSAPVHALKLRAAAMAYARLCDPSGLDEQRAAACRRITRSMAANSDMVAGPGRFDTLAVQRAGGKIIAKAGAEGYQGIGILPGALGPGSPALGITFKIADGDQSGRARPTLAIEILRQLGILTAEDVASMPELAPRPTYNWRHFEVGRIAPCFEIKLQY